MKNSRTVVTSGGRNHGKSFLLQQMTRYTYDPTGRFNHRFQIGDTVTPRSSVSPFSYGVYRPYTGKQRKIGADYKWGVAQWWSKRLDMGRAILEQGRDGLDQSDETYAHSNWNLWVNTGSLYRDYVTSCGTSRFVLQFEEWYEVLRRHCAPCYPKKIRIEFVNDRTGNVEYLMSEVDILVFPDIFKCTRFLLYRAHSVLGRRLT